MGWSGAVSPLGRLFEATRLQTSINLKSEAHSDAEGRQAEATRTWRSRHLREPSSQEGSAVAISRPAELTEATWPGKTLTPKTELILALQRCWGKSGSVLLGMCIVGSGGFEKSIGPMDLPGLTGPARQPSRLAVTARLARFERPSEPVNLLHGLNRVDHARCIYQGI